MGQKHCTRQAQYEMCVRVCKNNEKRGKIGVTRNLTQDLSMWARVADQLGYSLNCEDKMQS